MRAVVTLSLAALGVASIGCAGVPLAPVDLPANLTEMLDNCGEAFTPLVAPPGTVASDAVLQRLRADGFPPFAPPDARPAAPVYGVIADREASTCDWDGLAPAGEPLQVWLVVWPAVSGANGGTAWAAVDARSGTFIVGDGPPGG